MWPNWFRLGTRWRPTVFWLTARSHSQIHLLEPKTFSAWFLPDRVMDFKAGGFTRPPAFFLTPLNFPWFKGFTALQTDPAGGPLKIILSSALSRFSRRGNRRSLPVGSPLKLPAAMLNQLFRNTFRPLASDRMTVRWM